MRRTNIASRPGPAWPVPQLSLLTVGLTVAVTVVVSGLQVRAWSFVSLSHLSGLPRGSLLISGPIIAAIVCYTTGALSAKRSPVSSPLAIRRSQELPVKLLLWFPAAALAGYFVGGGLIVVVYARQALDGHVNWFEFVLSSLQVVGVVELAILFGFLSARWWMTVVASLATLMWMVVLPVLGGVFLPAYEYSVGHEFIFPATPAFRHELYVGARSLTVVVLWIILVSFLAAAVLWTAKAQAGFGRFPTLVAALGVAAIVCAAWVAMDDRPFYGDPEPGETVCEIRDNWEYCVAFEEQGSLLALINATEPVIERAGVLAEGPHRVISVTVWMWEGRPESSNIPTATVSVGHLWPVSINEVASMLSGWDACSIEPGLLEGSEDLAQTLSTWISGINDSYRYTDLGEALDAATPQERDQWFETYRDEISSCSLEGVPLP